MSIEKIRAAFVSEMRQSFQAYLDESREESDNFIQGMDVTYKQAVELFNDVLLAANHGEPLGKNVVLDPTDGHNQTAGIVNSVDY